MPPVPAAPEDAIVDTLLGLDPLADLPRTGWLLRGVRPCESVADHSYAVAVVALLLTDALRASGEVVDGERVLRLALVHDIAEARTGDMPMPSKTEAAARALAQVEEQAARELLPQALLEAWREAQEAVSLEARIVKAADKLQMMIKVLSYQRQGRGDLEEFWHNPGNFRDMGLPLAARIYERLCERAGRQRPKW
jgi:putative hydrolase of HD superfamily